MNFELVDKDNGDVLLVMSTVTATDRIAMRQLVTRNVRRNSTGWRQTGDVHTLTLIFEEGDK